MEPGNNLKQPALKKFVRDTTHVSESVTLSMLRASKAMLIIRS